MSSLGCPQIVAISFFAANELPNIAAGRQNVVIDNNLCQG
jgi:hypothetical protein